MCSIQGYTKIAFLAMCIVYITSLVDCKSAKIYELRIDPALCEACGSSDTPKSRECPDLIAKTTSVVNSMSQRLVTLMEAINRTRSKMDDVTSANDFRPYTINDFDDIYNHKTKLGRNVRRKASPPEKLLHRSYMTLVMVQTYMEYAEGILDAPYSQDLGAINNETRIARCSLKDYTDLLGVRQLKKKLCTYKPRIKDINGLSESIDYFSSILRHGQLSIERVLKDMQELVPAIKECQLSNCDKKMRLKCNLKKHRKAARLLRRRKNRKGKKDRKNKKCGKGKKSGRKGNKRHCKGSRKDRA